MTPHERIDVILRAALAAVDPRAAVVRVLRVEGEQLLAAGEVVADLSRVRHLWLVGAGKATARMAQGALDVLGSRVAGGSLTVPVGAALALPGLDVWEAGHPVPNAGGLAGAADALQLARGAGESDLVVCLLSGGASALWPAPPVGVTLAELQEVTSELLKAGAPIGEVNTVRKHLSRIAGGQLARAAAPAQMLTLAVSDVIGASADSIGSGPTLPDLGTFEDALKIVESRRLGLPSSALHYLQAGAAGERPETVKPDELTNLLGFRVVLSVRDALDGARQAAEDLGFRAVVVSDHMEGEARDVGAEIATTALRARGAEKDSVMLLWGGESTVTVRGDGRGGRNQELALAAALALEGHAGVVIASFGTDGRDGPTDAAGAVVDGETVARGRAAGLDASEHLMNNDAYTFLAASHDLLIPGLTGTNVNDVVVAMVNQGN